MAAAATESALTGTPAGITARGVAVGLAMASLPLHVWMLLEHSHGIVLTVVMSAMVLWCLQCAVGVVRRVTVRPGTGCTRTRALRHLWVMAGVMTALHVALLTGIPSGGGGHHGDHGAVAGRATDTASALEPGAGTGTSLMLTIVALEVAVCFACAMALRARHPLTSTLIERNRHDPTLIRHPHDA